MAMAILKPTKIHICPATKGDFGRKIRNFEELVPIQIGCLLLCQNEHNFYGRTPSLFAHSCSSNSEYE